MKIYIRVNENDLETIEEIKQKLDVIEEKPEKGLDGNDWIPFVTALTPAIIELLLKLLERGSVEITRETPYGIVKISASSPKKARKQLEAAIKELEENNKSGK